MPYGKILKHIKLFAADGILGGRAWIGVIITKGPFFMELLKGGKKLAKLGDYAAIQPILYTYVQLEK